MIEHLLHRQRLPLAGTIKLGIKAQTSAGVEYPKNVPYFVMPEELIQRDKARFERPTALDVMFHSNDRTKVFDPWYRRYAGRSGGSGGLLTLRCDGKNYEEIPTNVRERVQVGKCRRPLPQDGEPWPVCECGATPKGTLFVLLIHAPVGVYRLTMGGHAQIGQFQADLDMRFGEFGRLVGIPFKLVRRPEVHTVPGSDGGRIPTTGFPVRLDSIFTLEQALSSRGVDPYALGEVAQRAFPGPIADEPDDDDEEEDPRADAEERREGPDEPHADGAAELRRGEAIDSDVQDDESMCFSFADAIGIPEEDYRTYVYAKYRTAVLAREHVDAECAMFRAAVTEEQQTELTRRITTKVGQLRAAKK